MGEAMDLDKIEKFAASEPFDYSELGMFLRETVPAMVKALRAGSAKAAPPSAGRSNALRWTTEQPKSEGWYFWSHPGQRFNRAVDLFKVIDGRVRWYSNHRGMWINVHKDLEFAGPIAEPLKTSEASTAKPEQIPLSTPEPPTQEDPQ